LPFSGQGRFFAGEWKKSEFLRKRDGNSGGMFKKVLFLQEGALGMSGKLERGDRYAAQFF
jgi:hypothetical protein